MRLSSSSMTEHDEYWQKEFATLLDEPPEPEPKVRTKTSKTFFILLVAATVILTGGSIITRALIERGALYWPPLLILDGVLFFAFLYSFVAVFYLFERKGLLTEPIGELDDNPD